MKKGIYLDGKLEDWQEYVVEIARRDRVDRDRRERLSSRNKTDQARRK